MITVEASSEVFSRDHDRSQAGAVYTPPQLANWVGELVAEFSPAGAGLLLDLGAGEGALLKAARAGLPDYAVTGVEISPGAAMAAQRGLGPAARIQRDDVLSPTGYPDSSLTLADYWVARLGRRPAAIVMNPPWGADVSETQGALVSRGLSLARGQFDSYDLFCELAVQMVQEGGVCAFILPDSLLLPQHEPLRRLLLERGSLLLVARLGEGFFEGVYRGCMVVVWRSGAAASEHLVECVRLDPAWRRRVLANEADLAEARRLLSHRVRQSRFQRNRGHEFDLDVSESDIAITRIEERGHSWTEGLVSGRGVELSKSGEVVECPRCLLARPLPKASAARCSGCGEEWTVGAVRRIIVSGARPGAGWRPFIAGEDVKRYAAASSRWIETGVRGIKYKSPPADGEARLLVRKTGIGLNATLETASVFTNQVVFDYRLDPKAGLPEWYLRYVLGVLCSRVLFAYHIRKNGEAEWRSHPYVTQKTLASLPIPRPDFGDSQSCRQAMAIAAAVKRHLAGRDADLEIEGLVAGLYGLSDAECGWVASVLDGAQALEAIRNLRLGASQRITPVLVV